MIRTVSMTLADARGIIDAAQAEILAIVQRVESEIGRSVVGIHLSREYSADQMKTNSVTLSAYL